MAGLIKYTREQRARAYELFWQGRNKECPREGGAYTAAQIAQMTGVAMKYVYRIAHGER